MRLPRDLSGDELARPLRPFGYEPTRQTGSHVRLTTQVGGEHHVTVPRRAPLRVGTVAAIPGEVGAHLELGRDAVVARLFGTRG